MLKVTRAVLAVSVMLAMGAAAQAATLIVATNTSGDFYEVDTVAKTATLMGTMPTPRRIDAMAYDAATDTLYGYYFGGQLFTIDRATLTTVNVGSQYGNPRIDGIAFNSTNGKLYGTSGLGNLVTIDTTTGVKTNVTTDSAYDYWSLAYNSATDSFAICNGTYADMVLRVFTEADAVAGTYADYAIPSAVNAHNGLTCDPILGVYYGARPTDIYVLDPSAGTSTALGIAGLSGGHSVALIPQIPEPASASLLLIGGLGVLARRLKRKRSA